MEKRYSYLQIAGKQDGIDKFILEKLRRKRSDVHIKADLNDKREEMEKEINILTRLKHPNIVDYYGKFEEIYGDRKQLNIILKKLDCNLKEMIPVISNDKILVKKTLFEILNGLKYLHNHPDDMIHNDLKPENIMYCKSGQVKIIDFGLSKILKIEDGTYSTKGTDGYCSPEHFPDSDMKRGKSTDIFSFGLIAYELYYGEAFVEKGINQLTCKQNLFRRMKKFSKKICQNEEDEIFDDFLRCCLIEKPDQRWKASELLKNYYMEELYSNSPKNNSEVNNFYKDMRRRIRNLKQYLN